MASGESARTHGARHGYAARREPWIAERMRRLVEEDSPAHLARLRRSGLAPAEYARWAAAWHERIADHVAEHGPSEARTIAEVLGASEDAIDAGCRIGHRLLDRRRSHRPTIDARRTDGPPCPACGCRATSPGAECAPEPGRARCPRCDPIDPDALDRWHLEALAAEWAAYCRRPCYERTSRGGWRRDEQGAYPPAADAWHPSSGDRPGPREMASTARRLEHRASVARLQARGLVSILVGGVRPGEREGSGSRVFCAVTPRGMAAAGIADPPRVPAWATLAQHVAGPGTQPGEDEREPAGTRADGQLALPI